MLIRLLLTAVLLTFPTHGASSAELRGHGGPVRGIAVGEGGQRAITGSFDTTAILWAVPQAQASAVLRFHTGGVNAVALLPGGRAASAGEDGRIALWREGSAEPEAVLEGHEGPIVSLAVSPDGRFLGSASWDRTARIWDLSSKDEPRVLSAHADNVNGIAFLQTGEIATAGYDASVRIWPASADDSRPPRVTTVPTALNALAALDDGTIVVGGADGSVRRIDASTGLETASAVVSPTPVVALAANARFVAAAGLAGAVAILRSADLTPERTLVGPGLPVWSLAFAPNSDELFTGGNDFLIRRWDAGTGTSLDVGLPRPLEDPLAAYGDDPGAAVFRACVACHTLRPDEGSRAGPTLHGVMGRRIGTVPDFDYSPGFAALDIVWSPETIARLFEIGPHAYTPGTRMPEQRVVRAEDREALVRFLAEATEP